MNLNPFNYFKKINQNGQALMEYLIVTALMAVATISVIKVLSQNMKAKFANIVYSIQGKDNRARYTPLHSSHYKSRDLSDFFEGATVDKEGDR